MDDDFENAGSSESEGPQHSTWEKLDPEQKGLLDLYLEATSTGAWDEPSLPERRAAALMDNPGLITILQERNILNPPSEWERLSTVQQNLIDRYLDTMESVNAPFTDAQGSPLSRDESRLELLKVPDIANYLLQESNNPNSNFYIKPGTNDLVNPVRVSTINPVDRKKDTGIVP